MAIEAIEAIIRGAATGDRHAWQSLASHIAPKLRRFFVSRYSRFDADDLVQDTIFIVWEKLPNFELRSEAAFMSWLRKIATYVGLAALRQHKHERNLARALGQVERTPSTRQSSRLDRAARLEQVLREVDKLPQSYRRAVENMLDDGDARDLAERAGIEWVSARVLEHRTRALLRRRLRPSTPPPS